MLIYIILLAILAVGIILVILGRDGYVDDDFYCVGGILTVITGLVMLVVTFVLIGWRVTTKGKVAELKANHDVIIQTYNEYKASKSGTIIETGALIGSIYDYNSDASELKAGAESPFTNWFVVSEAKDLEIISINEKTGLAESE